MPYAQKNYPTIELGSGKFTIAQAGCLLTSFSNLLQRFGTAMDPPVLDKYFREHRDFTKDPDGAYEDLAWNSITKVNPLVKLQLVGSSALPPKANAIVKFHHQSVEHPIVLVDGKEVPNMVDHFCAVDRIVDGQVFIIDSWDGLVKSPVTYQSIYGKPIAWATYVKSNPVPVVPVKKANTLPSAPVSAPPKVSYKVITTIPGNVTAIQALYHAKTKSTVTVHPDTYYIYSKSQGMLNVSSVYGRPGAWINPADNTLVTKPVPKPPETYIVKVKLDGYGTSNDAANHLHSDATVLPGPYYVYNKAHGMVNITRMANEPGAWINPIDNVAPPPKPAPARTTPPTQLAAAEPSWKASYKPFPTQPTNFFATSTFVVHDLDGKLADTVCTKHDLVPGAGTFTGPDGVPYVRSMKSTFPNKRTTPAEQQQPPEYYGYPLSNLLAEQEVWSTNTDITTRQFTGTMTMRDHLVVMIGKFGGWLERFGKKQTTNG